MNYNVYLAPMAGVTDLVYRKICADFGPFIPFTEMISAKALHYNDKKTAELLPHSSEGKIIVQIFGHDPEIMAEGAKKVAPYACEINVNMGCPMPKISNNGDGSALMASPALAAEIISAMKKAVSVPVSVKFRKGITENTAAEFARTMEAAGADRLYVHGRTKAQLYSGRADLEAIAEVKKSVLIPVVGNGDIFTPEDAEAMIKKTGCDAVMVGRGALGNPFIFREIQEYKVTGTYHLPTEEDRIDTAARQLIRAVEMHGERRGVLESRKHLAWYLKSIPGAAKIRAELFTLTEPKKIIEALNKLKAMQS